MIIPLEDIAEKLKQMRFSERPTVNYINDAHLLNDQQLYNKLFSIRRYHKDYGSQIEIHNQNDIYYLLCEYNQGGYAIKVLCFGDVPYYYYSSNHLRKFDWYAESIFNKKIFGISEIVNINKDIIKLIKLQIFK